MMCLICHIEEIDLPLLSMSRHIKPGGLISIYVPCERGTFLTLARKCFTNPKTKRLGFDPVEINKMEHKHEYIFMKSRIMEIYKTANITIANYPFPFLSWRFNLWSIFQIRIH